MIPNFDDFHYEIARVLRELRINVVTMLVCLFKQQQRYLYIGSIFKINNVKNIANVPII